jgi:tetratricopeptide (TPR) repeat protein
MSKKKIHNLLLRSHEMIEKGKIAESLELLRSLEPVHKYSEQQKAIFYTLTSEIHLLLGDYIKAYEIAENGMECADKIDMNIDVVDTFLNMAHILMYTGKNRESMNLLKKSSEILKNLPQISEKDRNRRMGEIYSFEGFNFYLFGEMTKAIKILKESIDLLEKWGSQSALARAYALFGFMHIFIGEYNKAHINISKSQIICENKESPQYNISKLVNSLGMGVIFFFKGEIQLAIETTKKEVTMARKYNNPTFICWGLNNLGLLYQELGEWDLAIKTLKECLPMLEKIGGITEMVGHLESFFHAYISMGNIAAAQNIFHKIEQYRNKEKNNTYVTLVYRLSRAILMKLSKRTRDLGIAQEIFQMIAHEEVISIEYTQKAILYLCEMLLDEFKDSKNVEALTEFAPLLKNLQEASEKRYSYNILAETYVLEAKLSMLKFDLKKARHLLTKAQQIAERYGLRRLAIQISREHDKLLQNLEVWDQMKKENVGISERLEKSDITDQISTMLKKKPADIPETSPESPIILLIMSSSGLPLYTKIFSKDWKFNKGLFSGFLSAFNSFSNQIFSEGLDRANFGKFTILMTGMPPFKSCYVYEGQSFLAQQKFSRFNEKIQKSEPIWKKLTSADRSGKIIQGDKGEGLGQLVQNTFYS